MVGPTTGNAMRWQETLSMLIVVANVDPSTMAQSGGPAVNPGFGSKNVNVTKRSFAKKINVGFAWYIFLISVYFYLYVLRPHTVGFASFAAVECP